MSFSAYGDHAIRLLSETLADVKALAPDNLSAAEIADLDLGATRLLVEAYDAGERDPDALLRAGAEALSRLRGKGVSP